MLMGRKTRRRGLITSIQCPVLQVAAGLALLLSGSAAEGATLADSVNDWQAALLNDGVLNQGEFGWEYGYISNFTGMSNAYYGWHQNFYYWQNNTGIVIYWPAGFVPPEAAWGEGGDTTGCRPPMHWVDGAYPWAGGDVNNRWAAVRRWTSTYTGAVDITGTVGRYFNSAQVMGWDLLFAVAVNAHTLDAPAIYTRYLAWNDNGLYNYYIPAVPVKPGYTFSLMCIPVGGNAANSYLRMTAVIAESTDVSDCDLNGDGIVNSEDFIIFSSYWKNPDCGSSGWCSGADLNHDWNTDMADLTVLAANWLSRTFPDGDFDQNYHVDMDDFVFFSSQWNNADCDQTDWCQGCDFDRNRTVNLADLIVLLSHWLTGS